MANFTFLHPHPADKKGFVRSSFLHRDGAKSDLMFFPPKASWQSASSKEHRSLYMFLPG